MTNKPDTTLQYRQIIDKYTKKVDVLANVHGAGILRWLSDEIYYGKRNLKYNSVDFIIGKFLNKQERVIDFSKRSGVTIYIIGTFTNEFIPITKVADALSTFYLEMQVMPFLITISKKQFLADTNSAINKIRNGILIYDRERDLH